MGWFSRIEQPIVRDLSMAAWTLFAGDLDLHEAEETTFRSVHDCFVRRLRADARPVDRNPGVLVSPCDGIVVAAGRVTDGTLIQAKGRTYPLDELLDSPPLAAGFEGGSYVTIRLTSGMYHRFHAPYDCEVESVTLIPGDTWNVNPPALARVERLYCRNARAVVPLRLPGSAERLALVAVGAILVSSIQFTFLPDTTGAEPAHRRQIACAAAFGKGDELGHFEHGSTVVLLATAGLRLDDHVGEGVLVRVGQRLGRAAGLVEL